MAVHTNATAGAALGNELRAGTVAQVEPGHRVDRLAAGALVGDLLGTGLHPGEVEEESLEALLDAGVERDRGRRRLGRA
mgnify:CR=1 FL=1